jgi:hypothetical protein
MVYGLWSTVYGKIFRLLGGQVSSAGTSGSETLQILRNGTHDRSRDRDFQLLRVLGTLLSGILFPFSFQKHPAMSALISKSRVRAPSTVTLPHCIRPSDGSNPLSADTRLLFQKVRSDQAIVKCKGNLQIYYPQCYRVYRHSALLFIN